MLLSRRTYRCTSRKMRHAGRSATRLHTDEQKRNDGEEGRFRCQLVTRQLDEVRPHPSYIRHHLSVSASQLSILTDLGRTAFREPIVITQGGMIVDGYARCELARLQGRQNILCLEYDLTEEEALRWLIQSHRPKRGLNAFCRTLLALDLAPILQEAARINQRFGGQNKSSSDLTEARRVDVRAKTAATAGVSSGNVAKVEKVSRSAPRNVQDALKSSEIRVHRAWQWSHLSAQQQLAKLEEYRSQRGTNLTSRRLVLRHVKRLVPNRLISRSLGELLRPLLPGRAAALDSIVVAEVDALGRIAYFTKDALRALGRTEEST